MDRAELEATLCGLLATVNEPGTEVTPGTDLLDELALESAQIMEFVMEVEDHFDIMIEQERLADVRTIAQLASVVAEVS